ncbi:MAG: TIGR02996 domain-containing protein [Archangium sp.]|nr:TIGR02996 domain-containing protein [Archangium sp.]
MIESLFSAVFERPGDDGARQVLADALQEAGDPRGEFISLQLQARRNERSERRMQKLLDRHRAKFLRGLQGLVMPGGDRAWSRGFLSEATVLLEGLQVELPDLATLEKVEVVFSPAAPLELASPWMKSLREVSMAGLSAVPVLFDAKRPLAVESVGLSGPGDLLAWPLDTLTYLSRATSLPKLTRLSLDTNRVALQDDHWLWKLEVLPRLKLLELTGSFRGFPLAELLETLRRVEKPPHAVVFDGVGVSVRVRAADRFRSLHVELDPPSGVVVFTSMLQTLAPDALDDLSVVTNAPLDSALTGSLRMATRRLKLTNLELP